MQVRGAGGWCRWWMQVGSAGGGWCRWVVQVGGAGGRWW